MEEKYKEIWFSFDKFVIEILFIVYVIVNENYKCCYFKFSKYKYVF